MPLLTGPCRTFDYGEVPTLAVITARTLIYLLAVIYAYGTDIDGVTICSRGEGGGIS